MPRSPKIFIMIALCSSALYAAGTTPDTIEFENKHKSTIHQNWPAGDLEADQTIAQMLENIRAVAAQRKQIDLENNIPLKDLAENVGALTRSVDQLVQEVQQLTQNVTDIKTIAAQSTDPLVQMADALKNLSRIEKRLDRLVKMRAKNDEVTSEIIDCLEVLCKKIKS